MTALRLLHIDDEADIRETVAVTLGLDAEFALRSCASGRDGLAAAAADAPDLILLDVLMPVMDGPTTIAHLRDNAQTAAIPVVFMTARAGSAEIERFKSVGAAGVIAKPFDPMTLAALVRSHVAGMRLATARRIFLRRVSSDADALLQYWSVLPMEMALPSALVQIRDIAHGLADSAGLFGFPDISDTASRLEGAAIIEANGPNVPQEFERALENLLTNMMAAVVAPLSRLKSANSKGLT
jgi:two-component system OmpR family response regulator